MTYALSGCQTANSHWDFQFRITAALQDGTDCTCPYLRVTLFDNPKRTRLWIINPGGGIPNPSTNTANSPRLYVTKVLAAGTSGVFPSQGDIVRVVVGDNTGFDTGPTGTGGATVGTIEGFGGSNDTLHVLMTPTGGLPCNSSGPMAYYRVECGPTSTGPWTQLGGLGTIDPCTPMIQVDNVCVTNTMGNDLYRLGISVLNSCGLQASDFSIRDIRRNSNTNELPGPSSAVWTGNVSLNDGVTYITTTNSTLSGNQLWVTFTTDGVNFSQVRVPTTTTGCQPIPAIVSATNNQANCPGGDRTINVTWTGTTSKIQYRVAQADGTFSGNWTNQNDTSSPGTITLTNATSKCRAVQVRLCNGGTDQNCTSASATVTVPAVGAGLAGQSEPSTQSLDESSTETLTEPSSESSTTGSGTPESSTPVVEEATPVEETPAVVTPEPTTTEGTEPTDQ